MTDLNVHQIVSDKVYEQLGEGAVPISAIITVAYLDGDGNHRLMSTWDDGQTFWAREGMARVLLRDVTGVEMAAEREEYERRLHEGS